MMVFVVVKKDYDDDYSLLKAFQTEDLAKLWLSKAKAYAREYKLQFTPSHYQIQEVEMTSNLEYLEHLHEQDEAKKNKIPVVKVPTKIPVFIKDEDAFDIPF